MSKEIASVGLSITPDRVKVGSKAHIAIEITPRNAAGNDVGADGVAALGACYLAGLRLRWTPTGGPSETFVLRGKGGKPPVWADPQHKNVVPGTGPNPGYTDEVPEGWAMGVTKWISEQGYGYPLALKDAPAGIMEIEALYFSSPEDEAPAFDSPTHTLTVE